MSNMVEMPISMKNQSVTITIPADVNFRFIYADNSAELKKILRSAFAVRIVALLIIFLCTPEWSANFIEKLPTNSPDDFRYEAGALEYSKIASSVIDTDAFRIAYAKYADDTGYYTNWFKSTPLWYWICCVVIYFTHTKLAMRLLNILFACLGIKYVYLLAELLFDRKTALLACKWYAFLPYPVVFSCFSYKDHFIFLCTTYLLYVSFRYRYWREIPKESICVSIFMAFCCAFTRSGLAFVLILMCLFIAFSQYLKRKKSIVFICFLLFLCLLIGRDFIMDSLKALLYKTTAYQNTRLSATSANATISIASITGIKDIYKLPFTFLIAVIMPYNTALKAHSWSDIASAFNVLLMPTVAVGAFLDIFLKKHKDASAKLVCLIYYLVCIVTSIGIFRHYFSLLFIPVTMCAHYVSHSSHSQKVLHVALSAAYTALLLSYWLYKAIFR